MDPVLPSLEVSARTAAISERGGLLSEEEHVLSSEELLFKIASVGLPVFISNLVGMGIGLMSMFFVSELQDTNMLAAQALTNVMTSVFGFSWLCGYNMAITTISSHAYGAGSYHSVGQ